MALTEDFKAQCRKTFSWHGLWVMVRGMILPQPISMALDLRDTVKEADEKRENKQPTTP